MKPNLFQYSTSELSQDAFLCWLFEHHNDKNDTIGATTVAKSLLEKIVTDYSKLNKMNEMYDLTQYSVKIEQQKHKIDVLLTFESRGTENIYIIIEDKVHSMESREKQVEHYKNVLLKEQPKAIIIPVLFKTGYSSKEEQQQFLDREIVFIGYEEIHELFSKLEHVILDDVILSSWWTHFCKTYYSPIQHAKSYLINENETLDSLSSLLVGNTVIEAIWFEKITDYLFQDVAAQFVVDTYNVQGRGHLNWHYEMRKENWVSKKENIVVGIYFIWNLSSFSLTVKTSTFPYKTRKQLSENKVEEAAYVEMRDVIKNEIKDNEDIEWKIYNNFLLIAQMTDLVLVPLKTLKEKVNEEVIIVANAIDQIRST